MKGELIMICSIDVKNALIGSVMVAMILCLVGAVYYVPPEDFGLFQIETNDSHAFILDSATGQVWSSRFYVSDSLISEGNDPNFYAPKTLPHITTEP
jgi:hypothetical protein